MFLFPRVKVAKSDELPFMSEGYVAYLMAEQPAVLIANALARMGRIEYLIIAGLSDAQKSYLILPKDSQIIEIADLSEVKRGLSPIVSGLRGELKCSNAKLLDGLFIAHKCRKKLVLDDTTEQLPEIVSKGEGVIVIENSDDAASVVAVNYANTVNASAVIVKGFNKHEQREIEKWIQDWKRNGDDQQLRNLRKAGLDRIGEVAFAAFGYATFFTNGLPYGFIIENAVPCSHVNLSLRCDLFIINSILFNRSGHIGAAVIFSPVFFDDEETNWLSAFFATTQYYVRALVGKNATLGSFDFHVQHFPYDLLHICSHGGEVDGYEMSEQFTDRDGKVHTVEFEEVLGHTPVPEKPDMVRVHRKIFPRKLDGFEWMSPEIEEQDIPSHVILDMWKCMMECEGIRRGKDRIAMSCAIACTDSIHQGEFNTLAAHRSPLVFNNTCWSWREVAAFFLACGARGYIGTLWDIDNLAAVAAAQEFYENLVGGSVITAFHKAVKAIDNTPSKDIYIYWGLHFSVLASAESIEDSRSNVGEELLHTARAWIKKIERTQNDEVRGNSIRVLREIFTELFLNFRSLEAFRLAAEARRKIPEFTQRRVAAKQRGIQETNRSSLDLPSELREKGKTE
jgi:hypothetical protein